MEEEKLLMLQMEMIQMIRTAIEYHLHPNHDFFFDDARRNCVEENERVLMPL